MPGPSDQRVTGNPRRLRDQLLAAATSVMSSLASAAVLMACVSLVMGPAVVRPSVWYYWFVATGLRILALLLSLLAYGLAVLTIRRGARVIGVIAAALALCSLWVSVGTFIRW